MDFYQANAAIMYAQRRTTNKTPFWNRKLRQFNPFALLTKESFAQGQALWRNYATHHLVRPKGILTISAAYGGFGWVTGVVYKNRFHQKFEYH